MTLKALHFVQDKATVSQALLDAVAKIPGLELQCIEEWSGLPSDRVAELMRDTDILLASRAPGVPDEVAEDPGRLKYICYLHGTMRKVIGLPIIQSGIQVTNWGDRAGKSLAEGSFTMLQAMLKDLPRRILAVRNGEGRGICSAGRSLSEMCIGIYGFGFAGREFARMIEPFRPRTLVYDPYVEDLPEFCTGVETLEDLFCGIQALVIHAGLTPETEGSVSRELLARLPCQGIVINTARGEIIDQPALFDELRSGRLRAGLDVLWPDDLSEDHEARQWENLLWTCHEFHGGPWPGEKPEASLRSNAVFLDNIRAFVEGKPLHFTIDETRYSRMT